jgi:hypothetical protein
MFNEAAAFGVGGVSFPDKLSLMYRSLYRIIRELWNQIFCTFQELKLS